MKTKEIVWFKVKWEGYPEEDFLPITKLTRCKQLLGEFFESVILNDPKRIKKINPYAHLLDKNRSISRKYTLTILTLSTDMSKFYIEVIYICKMKALRVVLTSLETHPLIRAQERREWTVEKILDRKLKRRSVTQYLVKWEGWEQLDWVDENAISCIKLKADFLRDKGEYKHSKHRMKKQWRVSIIAELNLPAELRLMIQEFYFPLEAQPLNHSHSHFRNLYTCSHLNNRVTLNLQV
ncbi:hypothetical protein BC833DRAFT_660700 [Globomyces pollinis-pini]|nr:hypothetical protein BC833DRAFT_660700 [Globomyces pollinis-pini]